MPIRKNEYIYKNKMPNGINNICGRNIKKFRQQLPKKTFQRRLAEMLQIQGLGLDKNAIQRLANKRPLTRRFFKSKI